MARAYAAWLLAAALIVQAASACNNCVALTKAEKALVRAHGDGCRVEAAAGAETAQQLAALLGGEVQDSRPLRQLLYCVLRRGKIVTKDGKLIKSPPVDKLARGRGTKSVEGCGPAPPPPPTPEDAAWRLLRCGYSLDT